jgi:hypothetical protein
MSYYVIKFILFKSGAKLTIKAIQKRELNLKSVKPFYFFPLAVSFAPQNKKRK